MGPTDCKNVKKNEKKTLHQLSTWGSLSRPFYMVFNSENSTCRGGSQEFFQVSPG